MVGFDDTQAANDELQKADLALEDAWRRGRGIQAALEHARSVSELAGREPAIEDAKVLIAMKMRCSPEQAFEGLKTRARNENRKVAELARELVGQLGASGLPDRHALGLSGSGKTQPSRRGLSVTELREPGSRLLRRQKI